MTVSAAAKAHPNFVAIPDAATEGLGRYREPETPHPLQVTFLTQAGERAWEEAFREMLVAGRLAEADAQLMGELEGFNGRTARIAKATPPVTLDGFEDLTAIIEEFEGPPISAVTVGLTNPVDLVFDADDGVEPILMVSLFSDDEYDFSAADDAQLLAECDAEMPGWAGREEDIEFYADCDGLATLNAALVSCRQRLYLRDGSDGLEGRAPGGYVEYKLGCWMRTLRFLQAIERSMQQDGMPEGMRVLAGTVGLNADLAAVMSGGRRVAVRRNAAQDELPQLSVKQWEASEPEPEAPPSGRSLRERTKADAPQAVESDKPEEATSAAPAPTAPDEPAPRRGFFQRLFGR